MAANSGGYSGEEVRESDSDRPEQVRGPNGQTVQTNDIKTYYERRGDGPPIIFIHGMFMNTTQWTPQMAALQDEFTTIAYDVRGHGYTGGSTLETYTFEQYADDLHALLEAIDVERPVLCGLSMGGCIAQAYAVKYPENVRALVLSDTFSSGPLPLKERIVFTNLRMFGLLDLFVRYPTLNRMQMRVGNVLSPDVAGNPEAIQRALEAGPTISHTEFVKIATCMSKFPGSGLNVASITVPTLLLHGEDLPGMFRAIHDRLEDALSAAPLTTMAVPDGGHASNIDNPAFFTRAVREFVHGLPD